MPQAIIFTITGIPLGLIILCIARGLQLLVIKVIKRHTKTYAEIKRKHSLDEWEKKFDY